jgi:hypothetical protein
VQAAQNASVDGTWTLGRRNKIKAIASKIDDNAHRLDQLERTNQAGEKKPLEAVYSLIDADQDKKETWGDVEAAVKQQVPAKADDAKAPAMVDISSYNFVPPGVVAPQHADDAKAPAKAVAADRARPNEGFDGKATAGDQGSSSLLQSLFTGLAAWR